MTHLSSTSPTSFITMMNQNSTAYEPTNLTIIAIRYGYLLRSFFAGLLIPFGFAPFHLPGLTILGLALLYAQLKDQTFKQSFLTGFIFGLGFLGFGVSWVYISIHNYGHLNPPLAAFITLLFVVYLAVYPGLVAVLYNKLSARRSLIFSCFLFSAIWCLIEYLRSTFMGGFPWLLLGFGQIDTPLRYLLPILGVYGVGFVTCLAATFLVTTTQVLQLKRYLWLAAFIGVLLAPSILKYKQWTNISDTPLSVGVIQANLSMRDKWDESLFWQLLLKYKQGIDQLMGKKQLIVMPESAIPVPESYVSDFIDTMNRQATKVGSSILLGIPQPTNQDETYYYNTLIALGTAQGKYVKQHLVPFGEFIPQPFEQLIRWLGIPSANLKPGKRNQQLIQVQEHPIATLICYELAYPQLLRKQLPLAQWIVSISDDGWFGHSLAMYQQLQMAQVLSMQTGRFQVVSNNDGLSSIINTQGNITTSLPALTSGVLEADIYPATGATPWIYLGDIPVLLISLLTVLYSVVIPKKYVTQ
jgi:apolipoprotein N-acyltransferase